MANQISTGRETGWSLRILWIGSAVAFSLLAVIALIGGRLGQANAEQVTGRAAEARAHTDAGYLASELRKYRLLPLILADHPEVESALAARTPDMVTRLNQRLELIATRTEAAVIYVIDGHGETIAASNWRLPTSFVGQSYGFRPYFNEAIKRGSAEQFALGTVSRRPGLFLARRISNGPGVVVVKVEFGPLEAAWSHQSGPTIVRDSNGVVIMASQPAWRLRGTRALAPAALGAIARARLYGDQPPSLLAPDLVFQPGSRLANGRKRRFVTATVPVPVAGWTLTTLEPLAPALATATAEVRIVLLVVILVMVVSIGLIVRSRDARQLREAAQRELEHQVEGRTAELRGANERLIHESRERERNEARLRSAREELAQSNRLATLGQITAGVAHEINQPLAALRVFAENAGMLLEQDRVGEARPNLDRIVALSQRIGDITGELRLFARREHGRGPVMLDEGIEGALLLTGDRLRHLGAMVERIDAAEGARLVATDRLRIEQILMNLLQNACDALTGRPDPRITIATRVEGGFAVMRLSDNGPGIAADAQAQLFQSFATSKANGLGLGLVISRDLARDAGGDLVHLPGGTGATFVLRLPLA